MATRNRSEGERCVHGVRDRPAWDELVERLYPRLLRYVEARMGQHLRALAEPEDVVQETMLGLLRAAGQHGQELTETEVAKLAHIIAANRLRMLGRRVTATAMWREGDGIHLDGIGIASDDPGDLLMHHEGTARLVAALRALPDGEQRVIVLRQFERRSFEEVAELMGRPSGHAVGHLLSRARDRLRRVLGL